MSSVFVVCLCAVCVIISAVVCARKIRDLKREPDVVHLLEKKYVEFPSMSIGSNMTSVRWYSQDIACMDFVVIVEKQYAEETCALIRRTMDLWWESGYENYAYGELMELKLNDAGIPYTIIFHDSEDASDEYEANFSAMFTYIDQYAVLTNYDD